MSRPQTTPSFRKSLQRIRTGNATSPQTKRKMFLESLEDRRMMAVVEISLTGGALSILGDQDGGDLNDGINIQYLPGSDSYVISARAGTSITEAPGTSGTPNLGGLEYDGVNSITFQALQGQDALGFVNLPSPADSVTFNGGVGDDTLDLGMLASADLTSLAKNAGSGGFNGSATGAGSFTSVNAVEGSVAGVADSITGIDEAATWTINEAATSEYVAGGQTLKFANFEQLNGGTNTDSYTVTDPGAVAYTVNGGGGNNTLNLTGIASADARLTSIGGVSVNGIESTKSLTFQQINALNAGAGTNKLTGTNNPSTWIINDSTGNSAPNLKFSGFTSLSGGTAADTFFVQDNSVNSYTISGGDGLDIFQFGLANSLDKLSTAISIDGGAAGANLSLNDQGDADPNNYNLGATTASRVGGGVITYNNIVDLTINAGNAANTFALTVAPAASGTKTLNGGTGNDAVDLSALASAKVTLTAANATSGFNGTIDGVANFTAVEEFKGSAAGVADELVGLNATSAWTINDTSGNTYVSTKTAKFSGFETLTGGSAIDTFSVQDNSVSNEFTLNGGAGGDVFNLGLSGSLDKLTKNLTVNGGTDGATLTLNDQSDANANDYVLGSNTVGRDAVGAGVATYSDIATLTLNASNTTNNIKFTAIPTAGAVVINGGNGNDVLDLSGFAASKVTLTAPNATNGFNGTFDGGGTFTGVEEFKGSAAGTADEFNGLNAVSAWTINDTAGSTYVSTKTAKFSGFEKLNGGTAIDTFSVQDNSVSNEFTLNGGGALDAFNFGLGNSLDKITKNITVNGDVAGATLTLNDQSDADNNNYTLDKTGVIPNEQYRIGRDGGGLVTHKGITDLTLNTGDGNNTIAVLDYPLSVSASVVLNAGKGNDSLVLSLPSAAKVTLQSANATNGFDGKFETSTTAGTKVAFFKGVEDFEGSGAVDDELVGLNAVATWTINDPADSTYVTTKNATFSKFEKLTGGSAVDTFKIQNNTSNNPLTLTGNAGGDKFLIGDTVNKLAGLLDLTAVGGADTGDELVFNDQLEAGDKNYTISATVAGVNGGVQITHSTVEKIVVNASQGKNNFTVNDGAYTPATTITLVDSTLDSTLLISDKADTGDNTWEITSTKAIRGIPAPSLTIDYTGATTLTEMTLENGSGKDTVTISSTKTKTTVNANAGADTIHVNKITHQTSVNGGDDNDVINVGNNNLDNIAAVLNVDGGGNGATTRTVFKGGAESADSKTFIAASSSQLVGDTLNVLDLGKAGLQAYQINGSKVSRATAPQPVNYQNIEGLKLTAGAGDSDIVITVPLAADPQLPTVVAIDGGAPATADNRVRVIGNVESNTISVGNNTAVETNRSQFEVTNVRRLWVEGFQGKDIIHNRSTVPGLLDGGQAKNDAKYSLIPGAEDDIISSDAPSTATLSPVLLGNDGLDFLHTTNASASGTTFLVGDYFVNNTVKFTDTTPLPTSSRIQVVAANSTLPALNPGQAGDRYATSHPGLSGRNQVLARLDTLIQGRFNLVGAGTASNLDVIGWLQARLPVALTVLANVKMIPPINKAVREFVRDPGSAPAPAAGHVTYNPLGKPLPNSIPSNSPLYDGGEETPNDVPLTAMTNPFEKHDVNGDGMVTAFDALVLINELNKNGARFIDNTPTGEFGTDTYEGKPLQFLDVNGDMKVTAMDALRVINQLNAFGARKYDLSGSLNDAAWLEMDLAEAIDNQQFAEQLATLEQPTQSPAASSLSDDAIMALIAAHDDADDDAEEASL